MKVKNLIVSFVLSSLVLINGESVFAEMPEISSDKIKEESVVASDEMTEVSVASSNEMATIEIVVEDWMVPIYPEELNEGVYEIDVASSSSMFHVEECVLTVQNDEMSAVMTMSGTGYLKVFMGTGQEAMLASEDTYIPFTETEDHKHTYEIPVEALDCGIPCTAFSKAREKWYDRTLVFQSASLPLNAFKNPHIVLWEDLNLEDGTYTVEVVLEGGVGKTKLESPTELYVEAGLMMAEITFGSSNYDYVIADGEKCSLLSEEGNSSFLIPVVGFDYNLPIIADSIALGKPRELEYLIRFDSSTIKKQ